MITEERILEVLSSVVHPEYDKSIVELSIVSEVTFERANNTILIRLVFPKQDPMLQSIKEDCEVALKRAFENVEVSISAIVDSVGAIKKRKKVGGKGENSTAELSNIENIIAVASGKGGVGKSTDRKSVV